MKEDSPGLLRPFQFLQPLVQKQAQVYFTSSVLTALIETTAHLEASHEPVLGMLRQEDFQEFQASLGYVVRPSVSLLFS